MPADFAVAELARVVMPADTATAWGDGFPPAASTPFVLGLAEVACHNAVARTLAEGEITVGTGATIEHFRPTAVGATLAAHAVLDRRDGRRLHFEVEVREGEEVVARIEHSRTIVARTLIDEQLERS